MTKMEPTSSVRRPEAWHMAECVDGWTAALGRPYRDPWVTLWTRACSMRRRYRGP
ncbi:unnamed protein product [Staurois parvus]|uniref:Uncharacterized protein n=1 Tax=Staurois parvus TaxID=386267 RepID=A0ABN9GTL1_9NEOB|nr:unnamed protein product [Staurois parvus]